MLNYSKGNLRVCPSPHHAGVQLLFTVSFPQVPGHLGSKCRPSQGLPAPHLVRVYLTSCRSPLPLQLSSPSPGVPPPPPRLLHPTNKPCLGVGVGCKEFKGHLSCPGPLPKVLQPLPKDTRGTRKTEGKSLAPSVTLHERWCCRPKVGARAKMLCTCAPDPAPHLHRCPGGP